MALSLLAVAFTTYLAVGGLVWTTEPEHPIVQIGTVILYVLTTWVCIFWNARSEDPADPVRSRLGPRRIMPAWAAVLALAAAATVPNASWYAADASGRLEGYATWSLGAIGALGAIVMVRRRPVAAWACVFLAAVSAAAWIGPLDALALGAVGAALWVGVAQLISWLMDRAARDTAQLTEAQREASEWLASQEGMRRERRTQVQRALAVAGPVLAHTIAVGGHLDARERELARVAEATLRDELRGAALLDDDVRAALAAARSRGATVSVLDEGGLDEVDADARAELRAELAAVLDSARSERLYVRTSTHADVAVTVVGRSEGEDGEEEVDLWHEVRRRP
ncbi:MAG: hypothetical protein J0I43_15435 [Microbacterium sp.]|uniref:hypothetical protein n=1 Tax=Microbacterium sp. TaxID=51671 RepID=UPI001AD1FDF4|nr:hypothetical protein [Microbacterium sp.]MBN9178744.1 hypothetical protein [Microbacterium sp.]